MIEILNNIVLIISVIFTFAIGFLAAKRVVSQRFASVKIIKAQVVDKYKPNHVSKYPESMGSQNYVVVFEAKGKRMSFNVSEFSYGSYTLKQKGTLKYKGNRLISFK